MSDEMYMRRAMELAEKGRGRTNPNPMVGAVIIKDGAVVGEGYHEKVGRPHAEINALRAAEEKAKGAVMYVTLEPCPTHGRTPPCTEAIIAAELDQVAVGLTDPNPQVSGRGIDQLKKAGIKVSTNILRDRIKRQNEAYIKYITSGRPFVLAKIAMSLDGKVATKTGESRWISGDEARLVVHRLRNEYDAVLVGIGTVLKDNPRLDVRLKKEEAKQPLRVVVDSQGQTPTNSWLVQLALEIPTIVATTQKMPVKKITALTKSQVEVLVLPEKDGMVDLSELLSELGRREMVSVMVEGGPTLNTALIKQGLVDKFIFFIAPKIIGRDGLNFFADAGGAELKEVINLVPAEIKRIGEDLMVEAYV